MVINNNSALLQQCQTKTNCQAQVQQSMDKVCVRIKHNKRVQMLSLLQHAIELQLLLRNHRLRNDTRDQLPRVISFMHRVVPQRQVNINHKHKHTTMNNKSRSQIYHLYHHCRRHRIVRTASVVVRNTDLRMRVLQVSVIRVMNLQMNGI